MAKGEDGSAKNARPSYARIHARPLPVDIHPLPPLIPHNPLSVLHIGFVFFWQLLFPPDARRKEPYRGYFSPETRSVHVTDELSICGLWEEGFFGKGALSRSEPSWLHREKRRLGIAVEETAEEITARRREERKVFKQERARKEREEIEAQHRNGKIPEPSADDAIGGSEDAVVSASLAENTPLLAADGRPAINTNQDATSLQSKRDDTTLPQHSARSDEVETVNVVNQEHLQLDLIETFFLAYALGALDVYSLDTKKRIATDELLRVCLLNSRYPPLTQPLTPPQPAPDNQFFLDYVAYHHYRSLGWVVRSGVKFGVDSLLYQRGPAFAHAEFAVLIRPVYIHPYWATEEAARAYGGPKPSKSWHWLHMVNRVQTQVRKTLLLCFVTVPPPHGPEFHADMDIGEIFRRYEVRDILVRRWVPNRSRD